MKFKQFNLIKFPLILTVLAVLTFGFVCSGMVAHASMHSSSMSPLAVMSSTDNQQGCCNTSILKHIDSWKGTLLVLPREIKDALLLLLLGLAVAFALVGLRQRHDPNGSHQVSYGLYIRDNPELALFNQLKLAFARGILNPKIY